MDILLRGGTVIDGTGAAPRRADVRIRDGIVADVGPDLSSGDEQVLDASEAFVTPGFLDIHTHFDPSLFWDEQCDPMPQHGVTSVLFGNCSLSLAPVRPEHRHTVGDLFCYIEDLPEDVFTSRVPWTWDDYASYRRVLEAKGFGVNVSGLVGHSVLRLHVMGERAWEGPATPDDRVAIAQLLRECLGAGACGLSSSLGFDEDRSGRFVPSRLADDAELAALVDVLADHDAFVQFIPRPTSIPEMREDVERMAALCRRRGVLNTWIGVTANHGDTGHHELLDLTAELRAAGSRSYPQVSPRPLDNRVNWSGGMSFATFRRTWHPVVQGTAAEKRSMLASPSWRAADRDEWDRTEWALFRHRALDQVRLMSAERAEDQAWIGATVAQLVAERGGHPSDVLADWVLANDLHPELVNFGSRNRDPEPVAANLVHPTVVLGNSDAGAHLQMFCAAGDPTLLLARHVRERGDLRVEAAVHMLTGQTADVFGFPGRGRLEPGRRGDVTVFALEDLHFEPEILVADLPGGARRFRRPEGGYRYTIVGGTVTQADGELTGARPGAFLARGS